MELNMPSKTDAFERMGYPFAVLHKTVDREGSCNHTAIIGGDIDPTEIAGIAGPLRLQFVPCYLSYH